MSVYLTTSCGLTGLNREIEYKYNNITILRIDKSAKASFYLNGNKKNKIWAEYSSDGDFSGYLVFKDDGKVMILSGNGYFQFSGDTSKFTYKRLEGGDEPPILGKSVRYIDLYINREIEENCHSCSEIKVKYKMNRNDWW